MAYSRKQKSQNSVVASTCLSYALYEELEASTLATVSTIHVFSQDILKLQSVLLRTFTEMQDVVEADDKIAGQSLKSFYKECYKECESFKNDIAFICTKLSTQDLSAIKDENTLRDYNKRKLQLIGQCLQLFDKQNTFYTKLRLEMSELIPRPHQDIFKLMCECLCRDITGGIENISTVFYHPLALTVDKKLMELHQQVTAISNALKVIDEKLAFMQGVVQEQSGKKAIFELRKILGSVLLNGTIHEKDLLTVVSELHKILEIIKKRAPMSVTPLVDSIDVDINSLQVKLAQWKLTGPAYYAAMVVRYGIPLTLGVVTTLIPVIPDVSSFLMDTGSLTASAIGGTTDAVIAGRIIVDQSACVTFSTAGVAVEYAIEENVTTHRNGIVAPHVLHNDNKLLVSSEYLWKQTIFKELILKWVEKNQLDLAMTVVGLTASAVTIPLTVTGVLAPVSASIIMGAVAGAKLSVSAAASVHDARKLAEAEKALMQLTLATLDKCYKKFERWNKQDCSRFFSPIRSISGVSTEEVLHSFTAPGKLSNSI